MPQGIYEGPIITELKLANGELENFESAAHEAEDRRGVQAYKEAREANEATITLIQNGLSLPMFPAQGFITGPPLGILSQNAGDSNVGQLLPSGTFIPLNMTNAVDPILGF